MRGGGGIEGQREGEEWDERERGRGGGKVEDKRGKE